ncbi:GGDEF domain-containing protein [Arcobacter sp. FWKO B]|uniref:GGDEF domain-containing protein n=1 Tax=Arcobacter sp. FWKO B TaxID=2593672 RepID=UPI0018A45CA1|nr:GGDEF domain-containing protein [Arcobacter sp. FWKO B]QOG11697.1 GGDEF domain-containing protein [Arcobacter sp. FWKO B]
MKNATKIANEVLNNLQTSGIEPTPKEYNKEFCKLATSVKLSIKECEEFKELILKLSKEEQNLIEQNNISTAEDLVHILLKRVATSNVTNLANLLKDSLLPSISLEIDEKLARFCIKIGDSPSLIFEEDIQKEIESFIAKRFEADKKIVQQKTSDIAKLITLMSKHLNDAIASSANGAKNVSNIKTSIESIDINKVEHAKLIELQGKLVSAAKNIEDEMSQASQNLSYGKSQVDTLNEKIKTLEIELALTKQKSKIDSLTNLFNRGAFDEETNKFENRFTREKKNYAIVFFDLDHFKNLNDTYGHDAGDSVLKTFAVILKKETRVADVVARYGGEEFVALINFNTKPDLQKYLDRIQKIVRGSKFKYKDHKIKVTFSAGVSIRSNHKSFADTINSADKLLYNAKNSGRDTIVLE